MMQAPTARDLIPPQAFDARLSLPALAVDMALAGVLAWLLAWTYVHCGSALSNRKRFGRTFVLLAMTTTLIISVVKANLALSLGLVGALSIVRFRAAIKEPEELAYLFIAISIGLGLGANQREPTLVAFAAIVAVAWIKRLFARAESTQNLLLTVTSREPARLGLERIVATLEKHCSGVDLKRFDERSDVLEASFLVDFDDLARLSESKAELRALEPGVSVTFVESKGLA